MNYIHQLQGEVREVKRELEVLKEELNGLRGYLASRKFWCGDRLDGYVNVADVLIHLREAELRAVSLASVGPQERSEWSGSHSG